MSAGDLAFVLVVLALWSLHSTLKELRQLARQLRSEAVPAVAELRQAVRQANAELDRVDGLLDSAESVADVVESASELTYQAVSPPLIKVLSFTSGVGQGVKGFRFRRSRRQHDSPTVRALPAGRTGDGDGRSR